MKRPGQIALVHFPQADLERSKLRPVLVLARLPGDFDDWLVCMISSQLRHEIRGFDETLQRSDGDFSASGLKAASLIRVGRLAVIEGSMSVGTIGAIAADRLHRVRHKLASWLAQPIAS